MERVGGLAVVFPAEEAERGLEKGYRPFAAGFASSWRLGCLGGLPGLGRESGVLEDGALDLVGGDVEEVGEAEDVVDRRFGDAAEFPPFDRVGTDSDQLACNGGVRVRPPYGSLGAACRERSGAGSSRRLRSSVEIGGSRSTAAEWLAPIIRAIPDRSGDPLDIQ